MPIDEVISASLFPIAVAIALPISAPAGINIVEKENVALTTLDIMSF
ncbi:hypothetical protein GL267_003685 [Acidithiobacillus ferrianus]|uniref:Uncharacterized protein n=2 Tax=Acidithiobacillus ferrianus TaxID=2678518 RepID=A0A845U6Y5_9PROT|nr:hypothetical protein [Acidithiobacillus ferrianus]NDU41285.1 hypothetical protein [Acidithiobacillus ferrianus]